MRRREFIAGLGGAAAWPLAGRAQKMPLIGLFSTRTLDKNGPLIGAFRRGLTESGYAEGRNVAIEYRSANGDYSRLPALAVELARRPVDVLVSVGGEPAAVAARAATSSIPTVSVIGADPVQLGLAVSDNRPGGNTTGVNLQTGLAEGKRIGLLRELVPQAATIGVLLNPGSPLASQQIKDIERTAQVMKLTLRVLGAGTEQEIDAAFHAIAQQRTPALLVGSDPFFTERSHQIVALAARHAVPAMYQFWEFAQAGGLASYGIRLPDAYHHVGVYVGRILNGAVPGDLPFVRLDRFELLINARTAKALGIVLSNSMQLLADEVIE
jgi:putative tryptophan/tyrosine transport system substrate-binding protein